ncbi:MAG: L-histidine N(alpha)-methyltransferase [Proteobacteria bacterium]|nr:L-histidine N(alpha)-methyltransferase [Burkholderiales bacterium]
MRAHPSIPAPDLVLVASDTFGTSLLDDVHRGLAGQRKTLPAKWFYDASGSELFEAICELPEYYVTRTEMAILSRHLDEIAATMPPGGTMIEPGSGAGVKTRLLLQASVPATYVAIDISRSMLELGAAQTARQFPSIRVVAIHADYTRLDRLPEAVDLGDAARTLYFPGSTIGNFTPEETRAFLGRVARWLGPTGSVLIGVDTKKDRAVLEAAYDDSEGVTARFNLNLLARLNAELDADFDLARFRHRARYDEALGRVEMHLESRVDQEVTVGQRRFTFRAGETIHTESSYKYAPAEFRALCAGAGYECSNTWTDAAGAFAIYRLVRSASATTITPHRTGDGT